MLLDGSPMLGRLRPSHGNHRAKEAQYPNDAPIHTAGGGGEGPHQPETHTHDASLEGAEANAARLKGLGFCDYGGSHTVTGVIEASNGANLIILVTLLCCVVLSK